MLSCPYEHCEKTFSKRAALREHTKSHKGQAYWEILNNISDISNSTRVENVETVSFLLFLFYISYVLYDQLT